MFKANRIVYLYGKSEEQPAERLADKDNKRCTHYKHFHFTGREWGKCQNYHLPLDSSMIVIEKCADIIIDVISQKMSVQDN